MNSTNTLTASMTKVFASASAALVLVTLMSWTFVDATRTASLTRGSSGFLGAISVLVR